MISKCELVKLQINLGKLEIANTPVVILFLFF